MKKVLLCAAMLVFAMVGTASAGLIEYDFSNPGGAGFSPPLTFTVNGVEVTATATYNGFSNPADVVWLTNGLGVYDTWVDGEPGELNDEYLTLTFDSEVSLLGLNFYDSSRNDQFDLYVDNELKILDNQTNAGWTAYSPGYVGTSFTFRADEHNDNFTVSGMRIDASAPVPEPGTMLLMGTGLLGLMGYNRKRFSKKS